MIALGDFGAFGPHPDRTVEILREARLPAIQGNYEESLSTAAEDCHCGYTDPRDNAFAQISYDYTREKTSKDHKAWMATLPPQLRLTIAGKRLLLCHGSPRKINEFLWETATPRPFIEKLLHDHDADLIVCTHTGPPLAAPHGGRPGRRERGRARAARRTTAGRTCGSRSSRNARARSPPTFVPVDYDHARLAREMRSEGLPKEFVETIETGWWTTCLEILPAKERARGKF